MAVDVYNTVSSCKSGASNSSNAKCMRNLNPFLATGPLQFVTMDILGLLLKATNGNQHVFSITDR